MPMLNTPEKRTRLLEAWRRPGGVLAIERVVPDQQH